MSQCSFIFAALDWFSGIFNENIFLQQNLVDDFQIPIKIWLERVSVQEVPSCVWDFVEKYSHSQTVFLIFKFSSLDLSSFGKGPLNYYDKR